VYSQTLWEAFQNRSLSRRQFLKACCVLTSILGLSPAAVPEVAAFAEKQSLPTVIWLHGHECTGCSEAFLRSVKPLVVDVILTAMSLEYDALLSAAAGKPLENHRKKIEREFPGEYLVVAEGAVPLHDEGCSCMVGGIPYVTALKTVAKQAAAIIAIGTCASWGGIQAARPNPTQSVPIHQVITDKPIIKIPGCPPIPEILAGVIAQYALFGQLPVVDRQGRPTRFFGNTIHDTCYRKPFFEAGQFVETYDDAGAKAGWCLFKMGCRGPEAFNSCAGIRWWQGLSYPVQAGSPCVGCSMDGFWDLDPFTKPLADLEE